VGSPAEWPKGTPDAEVSIHRDADRFDPQGARRRRDVLELGRRYGVHPNTVAAWKAKYGNMEPSELARSRELEDENARMKRIIANLTLENDAMQSLI
jgi:Transposase